MRVPAFFRGPEAGTQLLAGWDPSAVKSRQRITPVQEAKNQEKE